MSVRQQEFCGQAMDAVVASVMQMTGQQTGTDTLQEQIIQLSVAWDADLALTCAQQLRAGTGQQQPKLAKWWQASFKEMKYSSRMVQIAAELSALAVDMQEVSEISKHTAVKDCSVHELKTDSYSLVSRLESLGTLCGDLQMSKAQWLKSAIERGERLRKLLVSEGSCELAECVEQLLRVEMPVIGPWQVSFECMF